MQTGKQQEAGEQAINRRGWRTDRKQKEAAWRTDREQKEAGEQTGNRKRLAYRQETERGWQTDRQTERGWRTDRNWRTDRKQTNILCREGLFLLLYNELAVAQGPKIYQKNEL
jgi:hypothetical protein